MRRAGLRFSIVAISICCASLAIARFNGPPASKTNARGFPDIPAESNCTFCHDPDTHGVNDPSGKLEILDLPDTFQPDTDYPLRVRLTHTFDPQPPDPLDWGFQLTAVRADSGGGYGWFVIPGDLQIVPGAGPYLTRQYVEHTGAATHVGDLGPVEWSFTWRSPSYFATKVYFYAAGNAGSGDLLSSNDYIFTTADSMTWHVATDVPAAAHAATWLARPSPNPTRDATTMRWSIAHDGPVDLGIHDLFGRRIRSLVHGERHAGAGSATWDGRDDRGNALGNGIYFARLSAPAEHVSQVQKIILAR